MASHSREASQFGSRSRRRRAGKGISRNARRSSFFQFAFTRNRSDSVAMRRSVAILSWNLALPPTRTVLMTIGAVDVSFPLPSPCGIANETRCCRLHNFTSNGYSCVERGHSCTTRDACLVFCSLSLSISHYTRELSDILGRKLLSLVYDRNASRLVPPPVKGLTLHAAITHGEASRARPG
jgi:hypothetical protein